MMISPETIKNEYMNMSYNQLLIERDKLIDFINKFESSSICEDAQIVCPSPNVQYQTYLEYLGVIAPIIAEKYNLFINE